MKVNLLVCVVAVLAIALVYAFFGLDHKKGEPSKEATELIVMLEDENLEWYVQSLGAKNLMKLGKIEIDMTNEKVTVSGYEMVMERSSDMKRIIEAAKRREKALVLGRVRQERKEAQEAAVKKMREELEEIKKRAKLEADLDAFRQRDEERKKRVSNEPIRFDANEHLVTMPTWFKEGPSAVKMPMARDYDKEDACLTTHGNGPFSPSASGVVQVATFSPSFYPNVNTYDVQRRFVSPYYTAFPLQPTIQQPRRSGFNPGSGTITNGFLRIGMGIR